MRQKLKSFAEKLKVPMWFWKVSVAVVWAAIIILLVIFRDEISVSKIVAFTPSDHLLAAVIMLALFAVKSLSFVIYCGILYAASGILFPLPLAFVVNLLGTAVMATIPYFIGKAIGASAVDKMVKKFPKAEMLRELREENDFFFVFLVRVIGVISADFVSLYMGAVEIDYKKYLIGSLLGSLPQMAAFTVMGTSAGNVTSPAFVISLCLEIVFIAASVLIYYIYKKKRQKKQDKKK